jgi:hypothetical protein
LSLLTATEVEKSARSAHIARHAAVFRLQRRLVITVLVILIVFVVVLILIQFIYWI